jgi:hypothetical protein
MSLDDSQQATRGQGMDAVAKRNAPVTDAEIRGHPSVCAIVGCRTQVLPWGSRLSRPPEHAKSPGLPCRQTTALAAQRMREWKAPAGVTGVVRFDAYSRCRTVGQACREPHVHGASTRTSHHRLGKPGWKLTAGHSGRNLWRQRRPDTLVIAKPPGKARDRVVAAGWLAVSQLGRWPGSFSRQGSARTLLGLLTEALARLAAQLLPPDERRWTIAPWVKDLQPRVGLGPDQPRPARAAVTPRHLGGCASARLPPLCLERTGAPGHRPRDPAADRSPAAVQDPLWRRLWEDLIPSLQEERLAQPVLAELERLRVA